jgi:hypothetical protein
MSGTLTTLDDLYSSYGGVLATVTGRKWWRKAGLQAAPQGPYAVIQFTEGPSSALDVVENVDLGVNQGFGQQPWGTTRLFVRVEFFRGASNDSALQAAIRFRNALVLEARFGDLWLISGLSGEIRLTDVSTMFRADVEGRAEVTFAIYANISDPLPLPDTNISEIQHQPIGVYRDTTDSTPISVTIP